MPNTSAYTAQGLELGVRNLDAIVANFYAADELAQAGFRAETRETAEELAALTSLYAPYDTGFMSEHVVIRYTPSGLGFEVGWDAADFFDAGLAFYPFFQEFGTYKMAAQPSLGPAWEEVYPDHIERIGNVARDALNRTITRS